MTQYAEECRTLGIPFIFDPGQQCARMGGDELADGINGAHIVICNDYELELIREKTGFGEADILERAAIARRHARRARVVGVQRQAIASDVPAVTPHRIADPTGVGDAYRGGFMKGLAHGADLTVCARLGSVAATYALEHLGGQTHAYTWDEFSARYEQHFGALARSAGADGQAAWPSFSSPRRSSGRCCSRPDGGRAPTAGPRGCRPCVYSGRGPRLSSAAGALVSHRAACSGRSAAAARASIWPRPLGALAALASAGAAAVPSSRVARRSPPCRRPSRSALEFCGLAPDVVGRRAPSRRCRSAPRSRSSSSPVTAPQPAADDARYRVN